MVLRDDLLVVFVIEDEVLDVIQQPLLAETNPRSRPRGWCPSRLIAVAIDLLFLVVRAQPVEEMFPLRRDAADLRFDGVRQHAKGVREEKLRNSRL